MENLTIGSESMSVEEGKIIKIYKWDYNFEINNLNEMNEISIIPNPKSRFSLFI